MRIQLLIVVMAAIVAGCQSGSRPPTTSPFQSQTLVPPAPTGAIAASGASRIGSGGLMDRPGDGVGPIGVRPEVAAGGANQGPVYQTISPRVGSDVGGDTLLPPAGVIPRGPVNTAPSVRPPIKMGQPQSARTPMSSTVINAAGSGQPSTADRGVLPASHSAGPRSLLRESDASWHPQSAGPATPSTDGNGESFGPTDEPVEDNSGRFGHAEDYSWLRGRLEYSQIDRCWKLRYLPSDRAMADRFGGSVVLPDSTNLTGCERGDFLEVVGRVGHKDPRTGGFSPVFHVGQVRLAAKTMR